MKARGFVTGLAGLAVVGVLTLSAPVGRYIDGRERVETLRAQAAALERAVRDLEAEKKALNDPARIELLAREELGLVRPNEVPYVTVTPEGDEIAPPRGGGDETAPRRGGDEIAPRGGGDETAPRRWYHRLLDALGGLLGR